MVGSIVYTKSHVSLILDSVIIVIAGNLIVRGDELSNTLYGSVVLQYTTAIFNYYFSMFDPTCNRSMTFFLVSLTDTHHKSKLS